MDGYSNIKAGIARIYKAQILSLIASLLAVIASFIMTVGTSMVLTAENIESAAALGNVLSLILAVCGTAALVLLIVSLVMEIIGLNASKTENIYFGYALNVVITGIICALAAGGMNDGPVKSALNNIHGIINLVTILLIIMGIRAVAEGAELDEKGRRTSARIIASVVGEFICKIITGMDVSFGIVLSASIAIVIIELVYYISFIKLLGQAKEEL